MGGNNNGKGTKQSRQPSGPPQTTALMQPNRRDSNWTVSTEGYGSMRSNTSTSRRCSELSQMSAMSGRQAMQSPAWDPISPGSSRRSSEAGGARMSPVMRHHLQLGSEPQFYVAGWRSDDQRGIPERPQLCK